MGRSAQFGAAARAAAVFAIPLALLVTLASLAGIVLPSTYARETPSWAAQGIGQDWVNLMVDAPWLIVSAIFTLRGSRRAALLLAAALLYTLYAYVIYAFAVHFNALFLVYCVALGLSLFILLVLLHALLEEDARAWYDGRAPIRTAGVLQIVIAALFACLWLSEIVPALLRGDAPASLAEAGFATNPVHVLDLSVVLPALAMSGVLALRHHTVGYLLAPVLLGFSLLMAVAIAGMIAIMSRRGVPVAAARALPLGVLALASALVLVGMLRGLRPAAERSRDVRARTVG
jgi:hypothetical protein